MSIHDEIEILNTRFKDYLQAHPEAGAFSRSVGSGDITCPDGFRFILESKNGYNDVDLCACFGGKCAELDAFLAQVNHACENNKSGRKPMLLWKKDRKETIVFIKISDFTTVSNYRFSNKLPATICELYYKEWVGVHFDVILAMPDDFFF